MASGPVQKRLVRSRRDRIVAGVCSGVASYMGLDPTLVRVIFVILAIFSGGLLVIAYIVLCVIMPEGDSAVAPGQAPMAVPPGEQEGAAPGEPGAVPPVEPPLAITGEDLAPAPRPQRQELRVLGWILLAVGLFILLANLNAWRLTRYLWPVALIIVGVLLLWPFVRRR